jgi:hypothetical protein
MWACSAIADDGALVISCWSHYFKKADGALHYIDSLSRWTGNERGNNLLKTHLEKASTKNLPIRMLVATAKEPSLVEAVNDASSIKKTFHIRKDMVGKLLNFDGDNFIIEFKKC